MQDVVVHREFDRAGLLAAQILALSDPALAVRLSDWRRALTASVAETVADD